MQNVGDPGSYGLGNHGLSNLKTVYWNLSPAVLVEEVIRRSEGNLSNQGAVVVTTGQHTGRSPNDKYVVRRDSSDDRDVWWGKVNQPFPAEKFDQLYHKMTAYLQGRDIFIQDLQVGAHFNHHLPIRVISEKAWASLFARDLFIRLPRQKLVGHVPEFTVLHCPDFQAVPEIDGTRSGTFIILDFGRRVVLIGGTCYAGEIKKSIFSVMNYYMPRENILSMHCSANVGANGDVALFFGLSGTGKTTLSSDPDRRLIGDDEHGWCDDGVFNFEGGCYAKTINLRPNLEPLIWEASRRFGTVLENVIYEPVTRELNFDDARLTENTRAAYPLDYVPNHVEEGYAGQPENIFFLTADAFGVMPPIARLTPQEAMYYFLAGYTSKLAGTEKGLGKEPQATFSTCFGSPFLTLQPSVYANLLGEKIDRHNARVWLINTGWTGGPYGSGERIRLPYTRSMVRAALTGQLDDVPMRQDPYFGFHVPETCPGVPPLVLDPQKTWKKPVDYENQVRSLIARFENNCLECFGEVTGEVVAAGPHN